MELVCSDHLVHHYQHYPFSEELSPLKLSDTKHLSHAPITPDGSPGYLQSRRTPEDVEDPFTHPQRQQRPSSLTLRGAGHEAPWSWPCCLAESTRGTSGHSPADLKADLPGLLSHGNRFLTRPYLTAETTAVK